MDVVNQWGRNLLRRLPMFVFGLSACGAEPMPALPPGSSAGTGAPQQANSESGSGGSIAPVSMGSSGTIAAAAGTSAPAPAGSSAPATAGSSGPVTPAMPGEVSYHKDIRPLIEGRCVGCHFDGGSGPFPLTNWGEVSPQRGAVVIAVMTRKMPPWLADDSGCTPIRDDQRLTDAQLALFSTWQAGGFPEGNEADFVPLPKPTQREIGEPSMIIKATSPFQLRAGIEDYYCLNTDANLTEDTWVTAMDMVPEQNAYVHHAIVNVGGLTCSALGIGSENIYSYRPGSRTLVFEEGDALLLPARSSIRIQFHYNTKFAPRGQTLPTDHSAFRIWTLPKGQRPARQITRMPHHDMSISIPVGAVDKREGGTSSIGREYTPAGAEIIGISPHMHYLGQRFKETLTLADGTDHCLVNIPDWDQDWQLDYFFEPSSYIKVASGARVAQECYYSNRAEDQGKDPEGNPFTPAYTTYGEDTRQEMCLGYIWFRYPLSGGL